MKQNYILQILDFPNNTTYRLCKIPNGFEWLKIDKFFLPISNRFHELFFDLLCKFFGQDTLGFKIENADTLGEHCEYKDIDKNKVLQIENDIDKASKKRINFKMEKIQFFSSFDEFWNSFTANKQWYHLFPTDINLKSEIDISKFIAESCTKIKKEQNLSEDELNLLFHSWESMTEPLFKYNKNICAYCKNEMPYNPRFPQILCKNCENLITDKEGKPLKLELFGKLFYKDGEKYDSEICYIKDYKFIGYYWSSSMLCLFHDDDNHHVW